MCERESVCVHTVIDILVSVVNKRSSVCVRERESVCTYSNRRTSKCS